MRTACSDLPQNSVNCMNPQGLRRRSASCPTDRADTALPTAIWRCGFWAIRKSATTSARGKSGEIGWICRSRYRKRETGNNWKSGRLEDWKIGENRVSKRTFHPSPSSSGQSPRVRDPPSIVIPTFISSLRQRLLKVCDNIFHFLQPNRKPLPTHR